LKYVAGLPEFNNVETVGKNAVCFALEQILSLVGGDVADGCKDIGAVRSATFKTVTMINAALPCLSINVKTMKSIVKVNAAGTQISAQERRVRGENCGYGQSPMVNQH
jgi:hypothetical protein